MSSIRRSTRVTRKTVHDFVTISAYPDGKPITDFERKIAILNQQAYLSTLFSQIDDIVVYALFASKRQQTSYRACIPDVAFQDAQLPISKEEGIRIRRIYGEHTEGNTGIAGIPAACRAFIEELPSVFKEGTMPIVQQ